MKLTVQTLDAKKSGDIELADDVFGIEARADILHRVVTWQLEKRRATARPTRERADVARPAKSLATKRAVVLLVTATAVRQTSLVVVKRTVRACVTLTHRLTRKSVPLASKWRCHQRRLLVKSW